MPNVLSTILGADKRVYLYGGIIAISMIGLIHFKQTLSQRDEIQIFTQRTSINKMDLITTELPLLVAPFAGIDTILYATEIVYDLIKTSKTPTITLKRCIMSSLLGFGLPLIYVYRNKNIRSSNGIRLGVKRFVFHISSIIFGGAFTFIGYRFTLWSLKYSLSTPFFVICATLLYRLYNKIKSGRASFYGVTKQQFEETIDLISSCVFGIFGYKIYVRMKNYEQYQVKRVNNAIEAWFDRMLGTLIWYDMDLKYLLFSGVLIANLFNFLMDSTLSKYFMPFSFKIRNQFLEQNKYWIYDSYYHYMCDVNEILPKEILCEIFSFAGIEQDFRLWIENDQCRIQYEEKHLYVQELFILAHICFSFISYRELYHRIKLKSFADC